MDISEIKQKLLEIPALIAYEIEQVQVVEIELAQAKLDLEEKEAVRYTTLGKMDKVSATVIKHMVRNSLKEEYRKVEELALRLSAIKWRIKSHEAVISALKRYASLVETELRNIGQ